MGKFSVILVVFALLAMAFSCGNSSKNLSADIDSETNRHLAEWHADKFGMFVHFGLYSVAGGVWNGEEIPFYSEQIMNHARIPASEYERLASKFNPVEWNAEEVVLLAKGAGMKYIVFTAKHHDGFCMFKTATTNYNVVDATPYGKDIVGELADACRKHGMKLGLYFSLPDWHYEGGIPRLLPDTATDCTQYVNQVYSPIESITPELEECIVAQITELLTNYGEIETVWFDMGLPTEQQSIRFRETVKSLQPSCLISGRIMNNQGDYLTLPDNGKVVGYSNLYWDNPASMYGTWGYRSWQERPDADAQALRQVKRLMSTVSHGGVFLLNVGPDGSGKVIDYEKSVLGKIGDFVRANSEAVYNTSASPFYRLDGALCTAKGNKLFFTITDSIQTLECTGLKSNPCSAYILDSGEKLDFETENVVKINLPEDRLGDLFVVVLEFADEVVVEESYVKSDSDGNIELFDKDMLVHAAFDAANYVTTQSESYLSWNIEVGEEALYDVFVVYTPKYYDRKYT
ncbi:MAG: alpha-L-fucosidase, partial [Bacteroidales bacterium]|nr:alpha-L-fucosidase [Bacteroidales bacterium]